MYAVVRRTHVVFAEVVCQSHSRHLVWEDVNSFGNLWRFSRLGTKYYDSVLKINQVTLIMK